MGLRSQIVAATVGVGAGALPIPGGVEGIPQRALVAYVNAAQGPDSCPGMRWQILAAVYRKESGHGSHGGASLDADGVVSIPIYGPPYDDSGDLAAGPGQFIPSSWSMYGRGGNPQDIDDAAEASVRHLCGTHGDVLGPHLRSAIVSYYGADRDGYADDVMADIGTYDTMALPPEDRRAGAGKERTPDRFGSWAWRVVVGGWTRTGEIADLVPGVGEGWRAVDDQMFGTDMPSMPAQAQRADGLDPKFGAALDDLLAAAPGAITVHSGKRDATEQKALFERAQAGAGAPAAWSDGVSCESKHCAGLAADLAYGPGMDDWAHANAVRFGLKFPYAHEPWHVELTE